MPEEIIPPTEENTTPEQIPTLPTEPTEPVMADDVPSFTPWTRFMLFMTSTGGKVVTGLIILGVIGAIYYFTSGSSSPLFQGALPNLKPGLALQTEGIRNTAEITTENLCADMKFSINGDLNACIAGPSPKDDPVMCNRYSDMLVFPDKYKITQSTNVFIKNAVQQFCPTAVQNLILATNGVGDGSVKIQWAPTQSAIKYNIYRDTKDITTLYLSNGGKVKELGSITLLANPGTYTDTTVQNGTKYYYVVTAVQGNGGESGISNSVNATPQKESKFMPLTPPGNTNEVTIPDLSIAKKLMESTEIDTPVNLKATVNTNSITLNWDYDPQTTNSFIVYRDTVATVQKTADKKLGTSPSRAFTDTTAQADVTYYYAVSAKSVVAESTLSNTVSAKWTGVPNTQDETIAPTGLTATVSGSNIGLNWDYGPQSNATFTVYRDTTSSVVKNAQTKITGNLTSKTFTDLSAQPNVTYYYAVTATRDNVESAISNVANAKKMAVLDTQAPTAPKNLKATMQNGAVRLDWDKNTETDVAGYFVYRAPISQIVVSPQNKISPPSTPISFTQYLDSNIQKGLTYYYIVTAVDTSGNESTGSQPPVSILVPVGSIIQPPAVIPATPITPVTQQPVTTLQPMAQTPSSQQYSPVVSSTNQNLASTVNSNPAFGVLHTAAPNSTAGTGPEVLIYLPMFGLAYAGYSASRKKKRV